MLALIEARSSKMADTTIIKGTVSGLEKFPNGSEPGIPISQHRGLFTSQLEPKYIELARAKWLYEANNGSAVGLADVETIPTTLATYGLYNSNAIKSLVVLKISVTTTTITAALGFALIAGLSPTAQASAETKYSGSLALGITPGSPAPGGYLTDAMTMTGTPLWITLGSNNAGVLLGSGITAWVDGIFTVPPKFGLGIDILGSAGSTPLYDVDILWAELDLGQA